MRQIIWLSVWVLSFLSGRIASAQPDDFQGAVAQEKPTVLCLPVRGVRSLAPLPKNTKLVPLNDLQLTGPMPSHPFVLGNFAADGQWGLVNGCVGMTDGKNAALQLAWADQFELDGVIEQTGYGGWFFLIGWDQGRGYAIHSVTMIESGSPWFISEFRGNTAIEDRTLEFKKFEWKEKQPFLMTVKDDKLSLMVGRFRVFDQHPLDGYTPGRVVIGVYDTKYGPKPLRIHKLRIQSVEAEPVVENP